MMKLTTSLTAALLATFALPTFAEESAESLVEVQQFTAQIIEQPIELQGNVRVVTREDGEQVVEAQAIKVGEAEGQVVVFSESDGDGRIVVRVTPSVVVGELAEINAEKLLLDLAAPDVVQEVAEQPVASKVEATYLGVSTEPLYFDAAKLMGVQQGTGLNVTFVAPESPAALAGLKPGDVLLKLNDQVLVNAEQLAVLIRSYKAGERVTLLVLREGEAVKCVADLSTALVPLLGPGGKAVDGVQWRVQQDKADAINDAQQPVRLTYQLKLLEALQEREEVAPMPIEPGEERGRMNAEELLELQLQLQELRMRQNLEAAMEQLNAQIQAQREQHDQVLDQIRKSLDLNLQELKIEADVMPLPQQQEVQIRSIHQDDDHDITLSTSGKGRHLYVKDRRTGAVLFDRMIPEGDLEKVLVEQYHLPRDAYRKVEAMMNGRVIEIQVEHDLNRIKIEEAPVDE